MLITDLDGTAIQNAVENISGGGTVKIINCNAFIQTFGDLPSDVLAELEKNDPDMYELYKNPGTVKTVNAPIEKVTAVFEDCDISQDNGSSYNVRYTA